MTFRTRPVLDRKHRPRWQDELRTQQLTVIAFAVAIALSLGIFGASAWNGYWESHFRPVAAVAGTTFDRADLSAREAIIAAEAIAEYTELQAQLGGPRDQLLQQEMDALSLTLSNSSTAATDSLVESAVLATRAEEFGVSVSDDDLEAGLSERLTLPERVAANLILVESLPADAEPDAEPTEEEREAALAEAEDALARIEAGEDFQAVAAEVSDDFTATGGGLLGWFEADDAAYDEYFDALADAEVDEIVGPVETERGYAVLQLLARREATSEAGLGDLLEEAGVDQETYRQYVRDELLVDAYHTHFAEEVATSPARQQRVAEIYIAPLSGEAVPQVRARHVLIAPLPDAADQSAATDEQWAAALTEAEEVRELLAAEDADWFEIAEERSADPGSGARGGDLGWYDPAASPYVVEFTEGLEALEVGELSEPVRTDFGYHLIEKLAERDSPQAQAVALVEELRLEPETFGATARRLSEDQQTAREDGEVGWVAPYQLQEQPEDVVFALTEVNEISDPVDLGTAGITIYQLLETDESREVEADRLETIHAAGFERWLTEEVRSSVLTWIDPQFASAAA
ncbi:MAG: peptidylprolyl isomerase [Candidatus Limnocylindria bacterium]